MTAKSATFDTGAIAGAIARAARIAPTKGAQFDKAAGILLSLRVEDASAPPVMVVRATNLDTTFHEVLPVVDTDFTENMTWRVSANLTNGILSGFQPGTTTSIVPQDDGRLELRSGKAKAKINTITGPFPNWPEFDNTDDFTLVKEFATKVAQVSWACDAELAPISGVHIDGKRLVATDRYKLAIVPCEVPLGEDVAGITVPLNILAPIMKMNTDASLRAQERRLLMKPNDATEITSVIYDAEYPPLDRVTGTVYDAAVTVDKEVLRNAIMRMLILVKSERYPSMTLTIERGKIKIYMNVPDVGDMEDEIEVAGGGDHDAHTILYTPMNFVDGLTNAPGPLVNYEYATDNALLPTKFSVQDYECWIVPRRNMDGTAT